MREGARAVLIVLLVSLFAISFAEAKSMGSPTLTKVQTFPSAEGTVCRFGSTGDFTPDYQYMFSSESTCANLRTQDTYFSNARHSFRVDSLGSSDVTEQGKYPVVHAVGEYVDTSGRSSKSGVFYTQLADMKDYSDLSEEDYVIHHAAICADRMKVTFAGTTASSPNPLWDTFSVSRHRESYEACDNLYESSIPRTQGWVRMGTGSTALPLPLLCTQVGIRILEGESADWSRHVGLHVYDPEIHGDYMQLSDGDDDFLRFKPSIANGVLTEFWVEVDDGSENAGGVRYQIMCIEPTTPHFSETTCSAVNGNYRDVPGPIRCCYDDPTIIGEIIQDGTTDLQCVDDQQIIEWTETPVVSCNDGEGDQLFGDTGYCCIDDSNFDDLPHLGEPDDNGAREYFCTDGTLTKEYEKEIYGYGDGRWWECTEELLGEVKGRNLCYKNEDEEYRWDTCTCNADRTSSDRTKRGNCGESTTTPGVYCALTNTWTTNPTADGACSIDEEVNGECCLEGVFIVDQDAGQACVNGEPLRSQPQGGENLRDTVFALVKLFIRIP